MVDAGFENQKELTKMQLDNQKEIAEMQNDTQIFIVMIQPPPRSTLFPYTTLFRSRTRATPRAGCSRTLFSRQRPGCTRDRSEEHTSELQSRRDLVCRLLLEKKKLPLLVWLTPDLRIKKSLLKCNWTIRKRLPRCKMILKFLL